MYRYIILLFLFGCYQPEPIMMTQKITFKVYYPDEVIPVVIRKGQNVGEYFMTTKDTLTIIRYFDVGDIITFGAVRK